MKPSPNEVLDAVVKAKQKASVEEIPPEHVSEFASVWALFELLNNRNGNSKSLILEQTGPTPEHFPQTFAEWAKQFKLESHIDRFVAIAAYLYGEEQKISVDINDVAVIYKKARWDKPTNLPDVFARAAKRMLFTEVDDIKSEDGLKQWRLTQTGIGYLVNLKKEQ